MNKHVARFLGALVFLFSPAPALAVYEYHVWNGFDPVYQAFTQLALIFSDNRYLTFFTAFGILALFFGATAAFGKVLQGHNVGILTWVWPVILGGGVYVGFFVPKTQLAIYDNVLNQNAVISNVPVGIAVTAAMVNQVEQVLVAVINTSAPPGRDYTLTAGGVGIDLLQNTVQSTVKNAHASRTLGEYVQNCVMFEITRPGTALSIEKLLSPPAGTTVLDAMADAKNGAIYTPNYIAAPEGVTQSCSTVYDEVKTYYTTATNLNSSISNACGSAGIDFTNASALARCQTIIADAATNTFGTALSAGNLVTTATVSTITADYFRNASAPVATSFASATGTISQGATEGFSSIFNSISRATFTAFVIALIPVVALFIPTPLCKQALGAVLSLFTWVIVWNVCELITHTFFMNYYYRTVGSIQSAGFGIQAMLDIPSYTATAMGMFGKLKAGAAGFATVITGALIKFGGSSMAHFVGRLGQGTSGAQSNMFGTPGRAGAIGDQMHRQEQASMARLVGPWANDGVVGAESFAVGKAAQMIGRSSSALGGMEFSGGNPAAFAARNQRHGMLTAATDAGFTGSMSVMDAYKSGQVNGKEVQGRLDALGPNYSNAAYGKAFTSTMQSRSGAEAYSSLVDDFAKKAGIDMGTDQGRMGAYGQFAAQELAGKKAVMDAFSYDKDGKFDPQGAVGRYTDYLTANQNKSYAQQQGELNAFADAKASGFSGGWRGYSALKSQMESTNSFANAQAWEKISAEHYGGDNVRMFNDINQTQNSQTAGSTSGQMLQARDAMAGAAMRSLVSAGMDEGTASKATGALLSKGMEGMREVLGKSEWGQGVGPNRVATAAMAAHMAASSQAVHAIAKAGGEQRYLAEAGRADEYQKTTPSDVRKGAGNEMAAGLGKNVDAVKEVEAETGRGARSSSAHREANSQMSEIAKWDMKQMAANLMQGGGKMAQFRSEHGLMSGVITQAGAKHLNKSLGRDVFRKGDSVSFAMTEDGKVRMAHATRGGHALDKSGKTVQEFNNRLHDTSVVKDSRNVNDSRSIVSSGVHIDTVAADGTHKQGVGVINPRTKQFEMTDGRKGQVVSSERVENTGGGQAVVSRKGDRYQQTVAVSADGSQKVDMTQEYRFGNAGAVNVGNVNASLTSEGWNSGTSLDPGETAKNVAIGGRSMQVASEKIGQALSLAAAPARGAEVAAGYRLPNPTIAGGSPSGGGAKLTKNQQAKEWKEYWDRAAGN